MGVNDQSQPEPAGRVRHVSSHQQAPIDIWPSSDVHLWET